MMIRLMAIFVFATALLHECALAQDPPRFGLSVNQVRVCDTDSSTPPDFLSAECVVAGINAVDPQGRLLWLTTDLDVPEEVVKTQLPLLLRIGALASSEIYWNNTLIGRNGIPAASSAEEQAGDLDAAFFVPAHLLKQGKNTIVVKLSSHHNPIQVTTPMHYLSVTRASPMNRSLVGGYYLPALLTAAAFVLAAVYFGFIGLTDRRRVGTLLIALMALFAGIQLCAESLRALTTYSYPWQVWRLVAVVTCSVGFGLSMVAYVVRQYMPRHFRWVFGLCVAGMLVLILVAPGFDGKALFVLLWASVLALLAVFMPAVHAVKGARPVAAALAAFVVLILLNDSEFLDRTFYLAAGILIMVMFIDQARAMQRMRHAQDLLKSRAEQLELELLRRRIAPHFLMNTLNALTEWVESDPATGVKMIDALADEFRLLSQMSHRELIPLGDEIALCRRHLEVMSYRVDREFSLVVEDVDETKPIPPGIIHTLIENAFTHGRYANGAMFRLSQANVGGMVALTLETPPVDTLVSVRKPNGGEGLSYVRKRLATAYSDHATFSDGPGASGGWVSEIVIPGNSN